MKNEIESIFDEAVKLMGAAVKKYKEGDFEIANKRRKSANKLFDEAHKSLETEDGKDDMMYGESRNFGKIYRVFEANTNKLFETKEGKKNVASIINMIKNDRDLSTEFKIYEAVENPKNVGDVNAYTETLLSLIESFKPNNLKSKHQNLLSKIREFGLDENVSLDEYTENLYENIDYIINNKKSFDNMEDMSYARKLVSEHIIENTLETASNVDEVVETIGSAIDEKYEKILTDDEKEFLSEITAPGVDLKKVFDTTKKNLKTSLMESIINDPENSDSWKQLLEKVNAKTYSKTTAIADIAEMVESQNVID